MPLILRPLTESDIPAYERIIHSAFSVDGLMQLFYPNGYTKADREHGYRSTLKKLRASEGKSNGYYKYMVLVDTDLDPLPQDLEALPSEVIGEEALKEVQRSNEGRVVGVSVWKFYPLERTKEEIDAEDEEAKGESLPPSADPDFMSRFFGKMTQSKRETLGAKAHVLLHILATDPAHHRRGVGSKSLEWGLGEADRLGVVAYLEASRIGRPLYEKWGFEPVSNFDFDGIAPHTVMVRPVQGQKKKD